MRTLNEHKNSIRNTIYENWLRIVNFFFQNSIYFVLSISIEIVMTIHYYYPATLCSYINCNKCRKIAHSHILGRRNDKQLTAWGSISLRRSLIRQERVLKMKSIVVCHQLRHILTNDFSTLLAFIVIWPLATKSEVEYSHTHTNAPMCHLLMLSHHPNVYFFQIIDHWHVRFELFIYRIIHFHIRSNFLEIWFTDSLEMHSSNPSTN